MVDNDIDRNTSISRHTTIRVHPSTNYPSIHTYIHIYIPKAPVGDTEAHTVETPENNKASDAPAILFPHIYGGLHPRAVVRTMAVIREAEGAGKFVRIEGL